MPLLAFAWLHRVSLLRLVACSLLGLFAPLASSSSPSCNPALQCCSYTIATGNPCGVQNTGTGRPINLVNGNKYKAEVDMPALPGVLGLELVRHYNSENSRVLPQETSGKARNSNVGVLGRGWRLSYDRRILWQGEDTPRGDLLTLIEGDGRRLLFTRTLRDALVFEGRGDAAGQVIRVRPATARAMLPAHVGWHYEWLSRGGVGGGLREHFDARGWMVTRMAPTGEALTVRRNTVGWPLQITDPQGRQLTLHYLPAKEIQANRQLSASQHRFSGVQHIDTPVGRFSYQYGGSDVAPHPEVPAIELAANLRGVTLPNQVLRHYHHEDPRWPTLLTGISIQQARVSTYLYDAQGRAVLSVLGHPARLQRHTNGQPIKPYRLVPGTGLAQVYVQWPESDRAVLINALGQTTTYYLTSIHGQRRITEARGPGCDSCSPGNTRYRFDKDGQLLEQTRITPQGKPLAGMRWQYDVTGRVVAEQVVRYVPGPGAGQTTEQIADVARYEHAYRRDHDHQGRTVLSSVAPQIITRPSVVPGKQQEMHMAYNDRGQPVSVTHKGWRPAVHPGEAPQPMQRTTSYRYSLVNGRSVLAEVDGPLPGTADTTKYVWDARGSYVTRVHNPMGLVERFERDAAGRVIRHVPSDGVPVAYGYAFDGEPTSWQRGPATVQVSRDLQGRVQQISMPDGDIQQLAYEPTTGAVVMAKQNGQARWVVPPARHQVATEPPMSLASSVDNAPQAEPVLPAAATAWPGQRAWVDDWGRLVAMQTMASGLEVRQYDANDRIVSRHLADGTQWRWERDALGRIKIHDVSRPGALPQRTSLHYAGVNLVRVEHPNETEYLYQDALGRLQARTIRRSAWRYTERYDYDAANRVTAQHLPEGGSLHYTWGVGRRLQAIRFDDGRASSVLGETLSAWLGWGQRVVIEPLQDSQAEQGYRWANGVELRWHLNDKGQLADMRYVVAGTEAPWHERLLAWLPSAQAAEPAMHDTLITMGYTYDAWGRMSQRQQDNTHTGYAYDTLGRLLVAEQAPAYTAANAKTDNQRPTVEYYAYDEQGRMQASQVLTHDQDWRQVRTQRDASGLPLRIEGGSMPARVLRYSADRRLIEVRQGGKLLATYSHNTHGQRIGKVLGNGYSTHYLWRQGLLVGETVSETVPERAKEPNPRLSRRYVYAHGVPVAVIDHASGASLRTADHGVAAWFSALWQWASTRTPTLTSLHANEIGTPMAATDAHGKLLWRADYSAYGLVKVMKQPVAVSNQPTQAFHLNLRLPGQYFDAETGWHDNGQRTYDPQRGQYLEPDPLGPVPNWRTGRLLTQPYAYANQNPVTYADPSGLILFAFDGTGNDDNPNDPAMASNGMSNVVAFYDMYDPQSTKRYVSGVGTVHEDERYSDIIPDTYAKDTLLDWITPGTPLFYNDMGGNFSGPARIDRMMLYMRDEARNFDKTKVMNIDIIGFSRGAAQARDFANRIVRGSAVKDGKTYYVYEDASGQPACQQVNFRFMGLWDTVLSTNSSKYAYDLTIPSAFTHVAHAVALNEYRSGGVSSAADAANAADVAGGWGLRNRTAPEKYNLHMGGFPLVSIGYGLGGGATPNKVRIERGFIGAHADIGGGYKNSEDQLSAVALSWMVAQASMTGVKFNMALMPSMSNPSAVVHDQSNAIRVGNPNKYPEIPKLLSNAKVEDRTVIGSTSGSTQRTMAFIASGGTQSMTNSETHGFIDYTQRNRYDWLAHPLSDPTPPSIPSAVGYLAWEFNRGLYKAFAKNDTGTAPTALGNKTGTVNMDAYVTWLRKDKGYCFAGDECAKPAKP